MRTRSPRSLSHGHGVTTLIGQMLVIDSSRIGDNKGRRFGRRPVSCPYRLAKAHSTLTCFGCCFGLCALGICTVSTPSLLSQRMAFSSTLSGSEKLRVNCP
jgi:hypothetical protein